MGRQAERGSWGISRAEKLGNPALYRRESGVCLSGIVFIYIIYLFYILDPFNCKLIVCPN